MIHNKIYIINFIFTQNPAHCFTNSAKNKNNDTGFVEWIWFRPPSAFDSCVK